jgi:hypothetical protein
MAVCLDQPAAVSRVPVTLPFFSQNQELQRGVASASPALSSQPQWTARQAALARACNRLGGIVGRMSALTGVPLPAALAVWYLESSDRILEPNRALIRFEVHHLWAAWGHDNSRVFDSHFQFGGRAGIAGHPWEAHAYRTGDEGAFIPVHDGQQQEYAGLTLAVQLAGEELAVRCISIGGCQLLGCDYDKLGYATSQAMYRAFQTNENAHVLGFFDFCAHEPAPRAGELLTYLGKQDFASFAWFYNGGGEVSAYAARLRSAAADAETVLAAR